MGEKEKKSNKLNTALLKEESEGKLANYNTHELTGKDYQRLIKKNELIISNNR